MNIKHYNLDKIDAGLKMLAENHKLPGPCFVGQGLSEQVGSDCYSHYIVANKDIGNYKFIWGIARGNEVMHGSWVEGDMDCSIDMATAKPEQWITKYGKHWYFCDENGKRYPGSKCKYGWNGAFASRDPSF